jgi:hypothetical protein
VVHADGVWADRTGIAHMRTVAEISFSYPIWDKKLDRSTCFPV